ncbi:MAG: GNAT family N-acetyltransferase [Planctomycetota bacterium]
MDKAISLRELLAEEAPITDPIYDALRFARTDPTCTRMLGAFDDLGELVGLGRLIDLGVHAGAQHRELGGMWVAPSRRGRGLAGRIIQSVIDWSPAESTLWCTPFEHLEELYAAHQFRTVGTEDAPPRLIERLAGCASAQDQSVIVMRFLRRPR